MGPGPWDWLLYASTEEPFASGTRKDDDISSANPILYRVLIYSRDKFERSILSV